MATVTRENIGLLNEKLVVKVEKDDYLPSFQKAIKDYTKKANIPGFRKGMVPVGMVKKMYGSSVFADEVIKSVEKGLSDYMVNEKLQIFAQPLPLPDNDSSKLDMNEPAEYQFAFEVGLKPEFSLPELGTAQLTRYKVDVTEGMVDSEVYKMRERLGKPAEQEAVATQEDEITFSFTEVDEAGNEIENGVKNDSVSVSLKNFSPEVAANLTGKKKDEAINIKLSNAFTDDYKATILKNLGLDAETEENANKFFKLTILNIAIQEKATLNEEFFKQVFPEQEIASEEDFKAKMKEEIQKQWDGSSNNQLQDQIYHELLHTKIEFPEDFLKRWMLNGTDRPKSPDEVEDEYPKFVDQLKWTLITEKISTENNIEVKPEDLRNFAKNQLMGYMGGNMLNLDQPWVNDYVERMMKDKRFVEDSFHRVQIEKIFEWAETQVHPTEASISEKDFTKLIEEHKHEH